VPRIVAGSREAEEVDTKLAAWCQGDVALGDLVFVHLADPRSTSTEGLQPSDEADLVTVESQVPGVVVVSQTCDIVRSCVDRPYLEASPLVEISDAAKLEDVRKGRYPRYLYVPSVAANGLVGDLDRTMTVEKPLAATWTRTAGCSSDSERRSLAQALARKRARAAFPNDFTQLVRKLANRIKEKHGKNSDEGRALSMVREIRVAASPKWDAPEVSLMFWFVLESEAGDDPGKSPAQIQPQVEKWMEQVPAGGRFRAVHGMAIDLSRMNAMDYVDSDTLDLDHLSV
jgi:hypothetical protein